MGEDAGAYVEFALELAVAPQLDVDDFVEQQADEVKGLGHMGSGIVGGVGHGGGEDAWGPGDGQGSWLEKRRSLGWGGRGEGVGEAGDGPLAKKRERGCV